MRLIKEAVLFILHGLKIGKNFCLSKVALLPVSSVTLVLTNNCNLRCKMCDVWKEEYGVNEELSLSVIKKMFGEKCDKNIRYVTLTGGEPFLREDIVDIYRCIVSIKPKITVIISSNGTLTQKIISFLSQVSNPEHIILELSMHGVKSHDYVTQTKGAFERTQSTVNEISRMYPEVKLRVKYVITPWNYKDIENIVEYCERNDLPLIIKMIENDKYYTNALSYEINIKRNVFSFNDSQIKEIISSLRRVRDSKRVNSYFIGQLIKYLQKKKIGHLCFVSFRSRFIASNGDVYACRSLNSLGNIHDNQSTCFRGVVRNRLFSRGEREKDVCKDCISLMRFLV